MQIHYIDFQDQNGNFYTPYIFDATTPYCYYNIDNNWTASGSNAEFIPFSWSDYVEFNGLVSTGSGNLPLKLNLYMGSDNPKDFTFKLVCSFTRTNVINPQFYILHHIKVVNANKFVEKRHIFKKYNIMFFHTFYKLFYYKKYI